MGDEGLAALVPGRVWRMWDIDELSALLGGRRVKVPLSRLPHVGPEYAFCWTHEDGRECRAVAAELLGGTVGKWILVSPCDAFHARLSQEVSE